VVRDQAELLAALELTEIFEVEDWLYIHADFDGDVAVGADGVELIVGRVGTLLSFPFSITELCELARELESEDS